MEDFSQLSSNQVKAYEKAIETYIEEMCGYNSLNSRGTPMNMGPALSMFGTSSNDYCCRPKYYRVDVDKYDKTIKLEYETQETPIKVAKDMLKYCLDTIGEWDLEVEDKILELANNGFKFHVYVHDRAKKQEDEFDW